jgi:hypothetical protein
MKYNNWKIPSHDEIALEYKLEYVNKGLDGMCDGAFNTFEKFLKAVMSAKVTEVTPAMDKKIDYRSRTKTKDQLINLLKGYRSWPEFRNEKTVDRLYSGFDKNEAMPMPMVLQFENGDMRVLGGNTRMDVAFQKGINPKVLMIKVKKM